MKPFILLELALVSTRNTKIGFFDFSSSMRIRTTGGDPRPRQFQAKILIRLGDAAVQPPPLYHPYRFPFSCVLFVLLSVFLHFYTTIFCSSSCVGTGPILLLPNWSKPMLSSLLWAILASLFQCPLFEPKVSATQPESSLKHIAIGTFPSSFLTGLSSPLGLFNLGAKMKLN